jgi:hypothetical protein
MQCYTVYLFLETALHVPGGTSTHHQERIRLYLQHLVCVTPLLLSAAIVEELEPVWLCCGLAYATHSTLKPVPTLPRERQIAVTVWHIPDAVDTVVCAPDNGWKYRPEHVEQFPDMNKLCNVAPCWMYIRILLGAHPILHISRIRVNVYCAHSQGYSYPSVKPTTRHYLAPRLNTREGVTFARLYAFVTCSITVAGCEYKRLTFFLHISLFLPASQIRTNSRKGSKFDGAEGWKSSNIWERS